MGKRYFEQQAQASFFLGPSLVWIAERKTSGIGRRKRLTIGLLTNIQLIGKPGKSFGFGLDLFANLNPLRSVFGARFALMLGNGK